MQSQSFARFLAFPVRSLKRPPRSSKFCVLVLCLILLLQFKVLLCGTQRCLTIVEPQEGGPAGRFKI